MAKGRGDPCLTTLVIAWDDFIYEPIGAVHYAIAAIPRLAVSWA
jgi:hypothetical protein